MKFISLHGKRLAPSPQVSIRGKRLEHRPALGTSRRFTAFFLCACLAACLLPGSLANHGQAKAYLSEQFGADAITFGGLYGCTADELASLDAGGAPASIAAYGDGDILPGSGNFTIQYQYALPIDTNEGGAFAFTSGTPYYIKDTPGLIFTNPGHTSTDLTTRISDDPTEAPIPFGALTIEPAQAYLTLDTDAISVLKDSYAAQYPGQELNVLTGTLYLSCSLDEEAPPDKDPSTGLYTLVFEGGATLSLAPEGDQEIGGRLETAGVYNHAAPDDHTITWTLKYTPYQNTDKTGFIIQDEIDTTQHTLVSLNALDAIVPGAMPSDPAAIVSITYADPAGQVDVVSVSYVQSDTDPNRSLLTISGMEEAENLGQPITITYKTKVADCFYPPVPSPDAPESTAGEAVSATTLGGAITNTAKLYYTDSATGQMIDTGIAQEVSVDVPAGQDTSSPEQDTPTEGDGIGNRLQGATCQYRDTDHTLEWNIPVDTDALAIEDAETSIAVLLPTGLTYVDGSAEYSAEGEPTAQGFSEDQVTAAPIESPDTQQLLTITPHDWPEGKPGFLSFRTAVDKEQMGAILSDSVAQEAVLKSIVTFHQEGDSDAENMLSTYEVEAIVQQKALDSEPDPAVTAAAVEEPLPSASGLEAPNTSPAPSPEAPPSASPEAIPDSSPEISPESSPDVPSPDPLPTPEPAAPSPEPAEAAPPEPVHPVQTTSDNGVRGAILPDDPTYYVDAAGVPHGYSVSDPDYWLDGNGKVIGYRDESGAWIHIGEQDVPLGFMNTEGDWVPFVPQTGDDTPLLWAVFAGLGVVLLGMGGWWVYHRRKGSGQ